MLMFKHELFHPDWALQTITGCANIAGDSHLSGLHSHSTSTMPLIAPTGDPYESRQAASRQQGTPHSARSTISSQEPNSQTVILVGNIADTDLVNWRDADAMHMCNAGQFGARHGLDAVN